MEIERERRSPSRRGSESLNDEISRHLEGGQQHTLSIHSDVNIHIHMSADLPLPFGFEEMEDVIFVDPSSREGKRIMADQETTISELFAIMRQCVSPAANHIGDIVREMLKRNVGVNDIDVTAGMSMLQYVIRSEAISSDNSGLAVAVSSLLQKGADPFQRTLYTDLNAFHMAAYFDCWQALEIIISNLNSHEIEEAMRSMSSEFGFGTPLHIAAANLNVNVVEMLVKNGADPMSLDENGRTPESCIPTPLLSNEERMKAGEIQKILTARSGFFAIKPSSDSETGVTVSVSGNLNDKDFRNRDTETDFHIGDYVIVGGNKNGYIKFIGTTKFSPGLWCGVELDEHIGKNDGSINGIRYFSCERSRGVFAPLSKVVKVRATKSHQWNSRTASPKEVSTLQNMTATFKKEKLSAGHEDTLKIGMKVMLDKSKEAKIKFVGETDFAAGVWIGLSLAKPIGKNNGTVQGREYFRCKPKHGVMVRQSRVSLRHHMT